MIPVPFSQVIDFVDWLARRYPDQDVREMSAGFLYESAFTYLRSGEREATLLAGGKRRETLETILKAFQMCPMIDESDIQAQMDHFARCGQCLHYLRREGIDHFETGLHPLLQGFLHSREGQALETQIEQITWRTDREPDNEHAFARVISEFGPYLHEAFFSYLTDEHSALIRDFEENRRDLVARRRREGVSAEGATRLISTNENVESAARRLAESVRLLAESNFYEAQVRQQPEVHRLLDLIGIRTESTPQAMEFIWWLQEKHPGLDILASVPITQVKEMVTEFCEEMNYENAASFSRDVEKWLKGKAERNILQRLIAIGTRAKRRNDTYRSNVAPLDRYQTVPFHAMFLFLSAGDFPGFIRKYWEDLNCLTGDHLDIYYSYEDVERRVSAFEVVEQFRSLQVDATTLPAILLWERSLANSCLIPLERLSHDDVFDTVKIIVQRIIERQELKDIHQEVLEFVGDRLDTTTPGPRIIVRRGDVRMSSDTYNVGQAGAVGPNAHASHMVFSQVGSQIEQSTDLMELADELSTLRQAMKKEATEGEQDIAVSEVAKAEQAAKAEDASKVAEHLKAAGQWALDVAIKVGVPVAIEALKKSLGLG